MGKIGICCCTGECCLCDDAWDLETFSVSVFGKTFSGSWAPAEKPTPFDQVNGCHQRFGSQCHVVEPEVIWDCEAYTDWTDPALVPGQTHPLTPLTLCGVNCGQCICRDLYGGYADGCVVPSQKVWEYSSKSWTHFRGWIQESHFGQLSVSCGTSENPNDSSVVVFRFTLYYQASRFFNASSGQNNRFRQIDFDCIYEDGANSTEATNIVYGDWIYPEPDDTIPPCVPCQYITGNPTWPQSTFFGNCSTVEVDCEPTPPDVELTVTYYTIEYAVMPCDFWDYYDFDNDGNCEESENDAPKLHVDELDWASSSVTWNTIYCEPCTPDYFPFGCDFCTVETDVIEATYESDAIDCDAIPCSVTLTRITGPEPFDNPLSYEVFAEKNCLDVDGNPRWDCDAVPALTKTLPLTLTLTLTGTCT